MNLGLSNSGVQGFPDVGEGQSEHQQDVGSSKINQEPEQGVAAYMGLNAIICLDQTAKPQQSGIKIHLGRA